MQNEFAESFFTKEQMKQVENMDIKDIVQLVKYLLWNESKNESPEEFAHFMNGATAMFDYASEVSANHWHGDPNQDKYCQMENEYLMETMSGALSQINPDQMAKWVEIKDLFGKIRELETKIQDLYDEECERQELESLNDS